LFGNLWLPQTTHVDAPPSSADFLPPSPPTEKATARQEQQPANPVRLSFVGQRQPFYRIPSLMFRGVIFWTTGGTTAICALILCRSARHRVAESRLSSCLTLVSTFVFKPSSRN
jgi:hypothetical protein